jgi:POT family proton-dependent oligopeptide transporter
VFKNHPRGLPVLFFTEMWERFAYYLMLGIFVLYMTDTERNGLGFDITRANDIYGWFIALVYLTPFVGGIIADRYLGYRKSVVLGGLIMAAGYLGIGLRDTAAAIGLPGSDTFAGMPVFVISLALVILGNGFFKPNISSIVGRLYKEGSPLKDSGYNIFYMGINIGAFVCNFVAAFLRNRFGWGWAFTAAGIGMIIGVIWFMRGQDSLVGASDRGDGADVEKGVLLKLSLQIFLPAVLAGLVGYLLATFVGFGDMLTPANAAFIFGVIPIVAYYVILLIRSPRDEKGPIGAMLAIFAVVVIFWMVFHQNGNTLTLWARDHSHRQAGVFAPVQRALMIDEVAPESYWTNVPPDARPAPGEETSLISTEIMQSINPGFIIIFTPLVVGFFSFLRARNKEPSTPAKIAWGLAITGASAMLMVLAVRSAPIVGGELGKVTLAWLIGTYGIVTIGELFLSPMGLSLVSKLAPTRVTALMMGGWFVATALGNKLAGVVGGLWERVQSLETIFWINAVCAFAAAVMIALMVPWIRRVMQEHEDQMQARNSTPDTEENDAS